MDGPPERPQPPADAYHVMAQLLGPHDFLVPPAASHVSTLRIIGADHRTTEWVVPTAIVPALDTMLRVKHPGVRGRVISQV